MRTAQAQIAGARASTRDSEHAHWHVGTRTWPSLYACIRAVDAHAGAYLASFGVWTSVDVAAVTRVVLPQERLCCCKSIHDVLTKTRFGSLGDDF